MGDQPLVRNVVLVDPPVGLAPIEDDEPLPGRQAPEVGNLDFDDEGATRLEVLGNVPEARDLGRLGREVHDRVEDEIGEAEGAVSPGGREVADRDPDTRLCRLGAQAGNHRLREVDAVDGNATSRERQRDPPRADTELKGASVPGELGEEVNGWVDDLRSEHLVGGLVVGRRHWFAEVAVFAGHWLNLAQAVLTIRGRSGSNLLGCIPDVGPSSAPLYLTDQGSRRGRGCKPTSAARRRAIGGDRSGRRRMCGSGYSKRIESPICWISCSTSGPAPLKDSASMKRRVPFTSTIHTLIVTPSAVA